jgi:hypothetical protein
LAWEGLQNSSASWSPRKTGCGPCVREAGYIIYAFKDDRSGNLSILRGGRVSFFFAARAVGRSQQAPWRGGVCTQIRTLGRLGRLGVARVYARLVSSSIQSNMTGWGTCPSSGAAECHEPMAIAAPARAVGRSQLWPLGLGDGLSSTLASWSPRIHGLAHLYTRLIAFKHDSLGNLSILRGGQVSTWLMHHQPTP